MRHLFFVVHISLFFGTYDLVEEKADQETGGVSTDLP